MRIVRDVLSLALAASALVGTQILVADKWLWLAAPSHAYGLMGFVILDILLTMAILENISAGKFVAAFASLVQIGAMIGDLFFGQPQGISSTAFRLYLASDVSYSALLVIKFVIVVVAIAGVARPFLQRHFHWTGTLPSPRPRT